jgi:hypothetical protein
VPGRFSSSSVPPMSAASWRAMARPRPVPPGRARARGVRAEEAVEDREGRPPEERPGRRRPRAAPRGRPARRGPIHDLRPRGARAAFATRLRTTCRRRSASARAARRSRPPPRGARGPRRAGPPAGPRPARRPTSPATGTMSAVSASAWHPPCASESLLEVVDEPRLGRPDVSCRRRPGTAAVGRAPGRPGPPRWEARAPASGVRSSCATSLTRSRRTFSFRSSASPWR